LGVDTRDVDAAEVANVGPPWVAESVVRLTVSIPSADSRDGKCGGLGRVLLNTTTDDVAELVMVERVEGEGDSKVVESIGPGWNSEKLGMKGGGPMSEPIGPMSGGAGTAKGPAMLLESAMDCEWLRSEDSRSRRVVCRCEGEGSSTMLKKRSLVAAAMRWQRHVMDL
jgi:hypothetical protein